MRGSALLICVAVSLALALMAAPAAWAPHPSKSCGIVAKGSKDYRVKARAVTCRGARKWVRAYLRRKRRAPGFRCTRSGNRRIPFYCVKGSVKAYWAVRL